MRKNNTKTNNLEKYMKKEYDFGKGVRGKYAKKYKAGTNIVLLEPDVAKVFKTPTSVNDALRSLTQIIKAQKQKI